MLKDLFGIRGIGDTIVLLKRERIDWSVNALGITLSAFPRMEDIVVMKLDKEEWRAIPGYGMDYFVSSSGKVASRKAGTMRILKPAIGSRGYLHVVLSRRGKTTTFPVHRLVLESFVGIRPDGEEARHLDGNKMHNGINNLKWGTKHENAMDKFRHGTDICGERNPNNKLTREDIVKIRMLHRMGWSNVKISQLFDLEKSHVSDIINNKSWVWLEGEEDAGN